MKNINNTVIVTGAGGLLGNSFISKLIKNNFNIVALDSNNKSLHLLKKKYDSSKFYSIKVNLLNEKDLIKTKKNILKKYGSINYLINSAALDSKVTNDTKTLDRFESFNVSRWHREIDSNLKITFLTCKVFGSYMAEKKVGGIINMGSDLTIISPNQEIYNNKYIKPITYSVAKFGILGMTKYLASYWAKKNVRVNCLSPGPVNHKQPSYLKKNIRRITPMEKILDKSDLNDLIVFLCSEKSSYITGQNFLVDGGRTIV